VVGVVVPALVGAGRWGGWVGASWVGWWVGFGGGGWAEAFRLGSVGGGWWGALGVCVLWVWGGEDAREWLGPA
jgi:hypothetical protein